MNRLWDIITAIAAPVYERLARLLRGLPWLQGSDTDIPPFTRRRRAPAAPPPRVEDVEDAPPVMRGGEGWAVDLDDERPEPPVAREDEPEEAPTGGFPPPPVPMAPPPIPYEEWDQLEDAAEDLPRMEPDYASPPPVAANGDDFELEEEAAEEVEPVGSAPSPAAAPAPEPESEPIPAAVGGEPAEKIQFSAYYPREVKPDNRWQPFRAYMFKDFALPDVQADAKAAFGPRTDIRATSREALQPVPEDTLVTAIPALPGFEFDPPQLSLRFRGDWRRFDFEFRAQDAPHDIGVDGRITFLVEGVIVADIPLSVYVSESAGMAALAPHESRGEPYQAIFCSYSHKDTAIVERVERASRYFNFLYLRDVTTLRSGESWNARLLELIEQADIFQLFWSKHAAASEYVRQEYLHAAALRSKGAKIPTFIRPIRWEEPMPVPPPPELAELHFDLILDLAPEDFADSAEDS